MKNYLIVILLCIVGCSTAGRPLVVSGEALKAVGENFVQIASQFKRGCDVTKVIQTADCIRFRDFGQNFQKTYPLAVNAWEIARSTNDAAAQEDNARTIAQLATDLSVFAVIVIQTFQGGK